MTPHPIAPLTGRPGPDVGCDAAFAALAAYADEVAAGGDGTATAPEVVRHVHDCADCREDAEGLVDLVRAELADE